VFVCVPGFADGAPTWRPLVAALADESVTVTVVDLPGFGAPPVRPPLSILGCGGLVTDVVRRGFARPVTLVGHSLGSVVAVEAAHRLGARCAGVVSIEGNLTPEDAYFSGQAADHRDAAGFKSAFAAQVRRLAAEGRVPGSYADAVDAADAESMWALGLDARASGASGAFGIRYRRLPARSVYLWMSATTPPETQRYLAQHSIPHRRLPVEHHWPWTVEADLVAGAMRSFAAGG
jgi:pimeloyl-ACP methyl ester carboxylesterase